MAKQSGIFKIEGKIDELSFYKRGDVYLVRNKGGVSRERLMNDPAFQRTRENISEFGMVASASRILRHGGAPVFRRAYDPRLHNKLMRLMTLAKNLDTLSRRGSRQVAEGFRTAEGRLLLRGFDFNSRAQLTRVLFAAFTVDATTGTISFPQLVTGQHFDAPPGATHVKLASGFLRVDFATGDSELVMSADTTLTLDEEVSPVLAPPSVPTVDGLGLVLLLVAFYQEVNGVLYEFNACHFNVLHVVAVV